LSLAGMSTVAVASDTGAEMAERAQHSARGKALLSATKFFCRAECEHRIPSSSRFTADMGPYTDGWRVSYPVSFTFQTTRARDSHLYCYTVTKNSRFSGWHFTAGWKQT